MLWGCAVGCVLGECGEDVLWGYNVGDAVEVCHGCEVWGVLRLGRTMQSREVPQVPGQCRGAP